MADPRKRVALNQGDGGEPPFLGDDGGNQERERDARSRKVQAARGSVRVLAQVERIEIAKGAKSTMTHFANPASTQSSRSLRKCLAATGTPDAGNSITYSSPAS